MSTTDIYHYIIVNDRLITGGQPTTEQLRAAAGEGFTTVINLATAKSENALPDEAGLVRSLGMAYIHIPVEWDNPTAGDFAAFERAMENVPAGKTLLHCAANFRATAFYALYAQKYLGWSEEQAEAFRTAIWQGSNYPVWERFIAGMRAPAKKSGSAALKTQPNDQSVEAFLNAIPDEVRRRDCFALLALMREVSGAEPRMWGDSIVGFGNYRYRYASGREGDWFLTGFSPRKGDLSLYILAGFDRYAELLARLGKHKVGKSCLYIKRLADIDLATLRELVASSVEHMRRSAG